VRFSLQDVKKSVQRRGGELAVSLHFLHPGVLEQEIARLIAYYEESLGQSQRRFSLDDARTLVGDYRLAHCLLATLSHWYIWRSRDWHEVASELSSSLIESIPSPLQLRLALYSFVNEYYQGFLSTAMRTEALTRFAKQYSLGLSDLEYLLALDSEEEALLIRTSSQLPTPHEVATLYNQWTFEAALSNSSSVHFTLDIQAFLAAQPDTSKTLFSPATGLGAAIKRLCFLARKLGVYYDLAYEDEQSHAPLLHLTLYGPQDVTGAPQQYGLRLVRLCRLLLGYGTRRNEVRGKKTLEAAISEAEATIHFLQHAYHFSMNTSLLSLLPAQDEIPVRDEQNSASQSDLYDSGVEQHFAEAFLSQARSQGVDGWNLEREPEPLILNQGIAIPDFALTRGEQRIYVEILGFWTPSYRERKIQKLQQLHGRTNLLLIIPQDAREAFSVLSELFPVLYYDQQIALSDLLQILRSHYDDFAQRLAQIAPDEVKALILREGLLTEQASYSALHCYRRSEIRQAAKLLASEEIAFLPGLGLYDRAWMQQLHQYTLNWLAERLVQPLSMVCAELRDNFPLLQHCEESALEILLTQWPEFLVERSSIFEAQVRYLSPNEGENVEELTINTTFEVIPKKSAKRPLKERPITLKKRIEYSEESVVQGDLWNV
jgi:predicted nuclease of restriction endonuclease-like RecB superfamily